MTYTRKPHEVKFDAKLDAWRTSLGLPPWGGTAAAEWIAPEGRTHWFQVMPAYQRSLEQIAATRPLGLMEADALTRVRRWNLRNRPSRKGTGPRNSEAQLLRAELLRMHGSDWLKHAPQWLCDWRWT